MKKTMENHFCLNILLEALPLNRERYPFYIHQFVSIKGKLAVSRQPDVSTFIIALTCLVCHCFCLNILDEAINIRAEV